MGPPGTKLNPKSIEGIFIDYFISRRGLLHKSVSNLSRKVIVCIVLRFLPFGISEL